MSTEQLYEEEIKVPAGVEVSYKNGVLRAKGPNGECEKDMSKMKAIVEVRDGAVIVKQYKKRRDYYAIARSVRKHVINMINGVQKGYTYKLKIVYSHFPMQVTVEGNRVRIDNFIGERHPRYAEIVGKNTKVSVSGDDIIVEGPCKESVSQTAANIENSTKIKNKDPRVFLDGVYIYERR